MTQNGGLHGPVMAASNLKCAIFSLVCKPSFKQSYRKLPSDGLVGYREANRICIYIYIYKFIFKPARSAGWHDPHGNRLAGVWGGAKKKSGLTFLGLINPLDQNPKKLKSGGRGDDPGTRNAPLLV